MSIATASKLLSFGVLERPSKEITLKCGLTVKVQALDGLVRLHNSGRPLREQAAATLEHGLVEPKLNADQITELLRDNHVAGGEIFTAILDLGDELDKASIKAKDEASKN